MPDALAAEARRLRAEGLTYKQIQAELAKRPGGKRSIRTIQRYMERTQR